MTIQHEIYSEVARNLSIEIKNGSVEALDSSVEKGKAVRVIKDGRLGFAFSTSPLTTDEELIAMALSVADSVGQDAELSFPEPPQTGTGVEQGLNGITEMSLEEKMSLVKELEASALKFDRRIKTIRQPSYEETVKEIKIRNSNGIDVGFKTVISVVRVTSIAEDEKGSERASEVEYSLDPRKINPVIMGRKASEKAVAYLNSRKISSRRCRALLDRQVVGQFLSIMAPSFFADSVVKNRSRFKESLGKRIYSPNLSIINDPTLVTGLSSSPYDSEGAACKRTPVVRGGILQNFLSDTQYSKKIGQPSTSSSIRPDIAQMPRIGCQNIYIEPGRKGLQQLKRELKDGFYITDVMGLHTVNQITGDLSVGAEGFWIENGTEYHGVKGVTIAGNIHEMLNRISGVGSDLKFWHMTGAVSLIIDDVSVSGS